MSAGRSTDSPLGGLDEPARVDGPLIETTWPHPFYIRGKGWVKAEDLAAGDVSQTSGGGSLRIAKVHVDARGEEVYNFEVAAHHNYYGSEAGGLLHNEGPVYATLSSMLQSEVQRMMSIMTEPARAQYHAALSPTQSFIIENSYEAVQIGLFEHDVENIKTDSIRFSTRIGLEELKAMGREGAQVNAFRHSFWQAMITSELGAPVAEKIAFEHETRPNALSDPEALTRIYTGIHERASADTVVDLLNSEIGRDVGLANRDNPRNVISLKVLELYHNNGLYVVVDSGKKTYRIQRQKLSNEQYAVHVTSCKVSMSMGVPLPK